MRGSVAHRLLLSALLAVFAAPADAQSVPEGIHSFADGPAEMCGVSGPDAAGLIAAARLSPMLRSTPIDSDRFELFVAVEGMDQLVVTLPSEPAHPAATCRHVYQDEAGNWMQDRTMRCDAGREACDRLFIEFRELDERLRQALVGER